MKLRRLSIQRLFGVVAGVPLLAAFPTMAWAQDAATTPPAAPAAAETAPPETGSSNLLEEWWNGRYVSGDWGGFRQQMTDAGVLFRLTYQQQYFINMHGGRSTGSDFAGSYDLTLILELDKLLNIPGAEFFIRGKGRYGGEDSDFDAKHVGGLFAANADAGVEDPIYVDKWWWRQTFYDERVEFRAGRLSTSDLFATCEYAGSEDTQFMNDLLSGVVNYGDRNGIGVSAMVWPTEWMYVVGAVIDADSAPRTLGFDEAFHNRASFNAFLETGFTPKFASPKGELPGEYRFSVWYAPGPFNVYMDTLGGRLVQDTKADDVGFHIGMDQMLWRENDDPKDNQGLAMFAYYGYAHGDVNMIEHYWSAGCQYEGLIPTRDKDVFGVGVGQGIVSRDYRDEIDSSFDRETVYECYYNIYVNKWLRFTPDLQVITQPGGTKDDRTAVVAGFRLRVNF